MTMTLVSVRERLRVIREERGLSYQDLADRTGISKSTLQRYETASIKNLPLEKLDILAHALGVTPAYLMGWQEETIASAITSAVPGLIMTALKGKSFSEDALNDIAAFIEFRHQREQSAS